MSADLDCNSAVVTVAWAASAGALHYTVLAEASGQSTVTASTTDTSSELDSLQCGEVYTVTVLAGDGACNSTLQARTTIETGKNSTYSTQCSGYMCFSA